MTQNEKDAIVVRSLDSIISEHKLVPTILSENMIIAFAKAGLGDKFNKLYFGGTRAGRDELRANVQRCWEAILKEIDNESS